MNLWNLQHGWWTLVRCPPDMPNIHCYGAGKTRKEAALEWVKDWRASQELSRRVRATDPEVRRLAA